jgi:thiol-disulfide isomerase/thioredoxin
MSNPSHLRRRSVLAGLASLGLPRPALADEPASPVAHGVLATNALALAFETAPGDLPDVMVTGPGGDRPVSELLKGRTVLMPIWAEWCVPCLVEIPDFARLQQVYGKAKFAIVPVLSAAQKQMTPDRIATLFAALNASIFEPLVEHNFGSRLLNRMAVVGSHVNIPCNVLIGPDGHVIAREMGLARKEDAPEIKESDDRYARVEKAASGQTESIWGTAAGDEFAVAMSLGFFG